MSRADLDAVARRLGSSVLDATPLAGGFVHATWLVTLEGGPVVVRLGGARPSVEAAVMALAAPHVPVPRVLAWGDGDDGAPPWMAIEHVAGRTLEAVLAVGAGDLERLGRTVAAAAAAIGAIRLEAPGFFVDATLRTAPERPWSDQLPEVAAACAARVPAGRLTAAELEAWTARCAAAAPALRAVDADARLVHADLNPKNLLVAGREGGWRVAAVLDWEFAYAGCPYGDAANMLRFADDLPARFVAGFRAGYAEAAAPGD